MDFEYIRVHVLLLLSLLTAAAALIPLTRYLTRFVLYLICVHINNVNVPAVHSAKTDVFVPSAYQQGIQPNHRHTTPALDNNNDRN